MNRYRPAWKDAEEKPDYKTIEEWARAEKPNRRDRRRLMRRLGVMSGLQGRGGRLQTAIKYNNAALSRRDLNRQIGRAIEDADRVRTAELAMLEYLEAEDVDAALP